MKTVHKILMCACIFYANYSKSQQVYFTEMNHFVFFDYKKQLGNAANLVGLSYYNIVSNDEISYEFGLTFGANYSYNLVNQQNDFDILLGVNSIGLINICYNYSIIQKHNSIQAQLQIPLMALLFNARVGFGSNICVHAHYDYILSSPVKNRHIIGLGVGLFFDNSWRYEKN